MKFQFPYNLKHGLDRCQGDSFMSVMGFLPSQVNIWLPWVQAGEPPKLILTQQRFARPLHGVFVRIFSVLRVLEPKAEVDRKEPPFLWLWLWPVLGQDSSKNRETDLPLFLVIIFHNPLMASREGESGICMIWMQSRQKLILSLKKKKWSKGKKPWRLLRSRHLSLEWRERGPVQRVVITVVEERKQGKRGGTRGKTR